MTNRDRIALLATLTLAAAITALAWLQPVSATDSDGAVALLATQALIEHGDLRLDPYLDDPRLAYELEHDYRVRRVAGGLYYHNVGVPILSLPAVWLARRTGLDMRSRSDEDTLQELISALVCGVVFLLLVDLGRLFLAPLPAIVTALVTQLGSSLISTLATGLWSLDYAVPLMLLALRRIVRWDLGRTDRPGWPGLVALLAAAYLCRPTTALLMVALLVYVLLRRQVSPWIGVLTALAVVALEMTLSALPRDWLYVLRYYLPLRVVAGTTPLAEGLAGNLFSPSRGLLIWSPFLLPVLAAAVVRIRVLARERLFVLAVVWAAGHLLFASVKPMWWGGQSFGPRLLAEMMLPLYLITALVARRPVFDRLPLARTLTAGYLVLGLAAIAIHAGQGLINDAPRRWNQSPDVDDHPELVFSWRYPQFLATPARLRAREAAWQRSRLRPLPVGENLAPDDDRAIFVGWWPPEDDRRWSADDAAIRFRPAGVEPGAHYLLTLRVEAHGEQRLIASLDGRLLGERRLPGPRPRTERFPVPGAWLDGPGERELSLRVPGSRSPPGDPRVLGLALRGFAIERLPAAAGGIEHDDDPFFLSGWSEAEAGWRWSDGEEARLLVPAPGALGADDDGDGGADPGVGAGAGGGRALELEASAFGRQRVVLRHGGRVLCRLELDDEVETRRCPLPADAFAAGRPRELLLELPDAAAPAGDPRRLGIALRALRLTASPPGAP